MPAMLATSGALSFVIAFVAVRVLLSRFGAFALDEPNARSLHQRPVPRTGGIAVLLGAVAVARVRGGIALAADGARRRCSPRSPSPTICIACPPRQGSLRILAPPACWCGTCSARCMRVRDGGADRRGTWITNLYNFMDGADGLAGGMASDRLRHLRASAAWLARRGRACASLCAALAAASAAFLAHNFHPARIFLGDVGSIPLGFLAGALGVLGWREDVWPLWFPVLVFGPFIADATVTLVRRLLRGEQVWRAHREHYYQRMVLHGTRPSRAPRWSATRVMVVCAAARSLGRNQAPWCRLRSSVGTQRAARR